MGENVRTYHQIHIHGLTAEQFEALCRELSLVDKAIRDDDGKLFKLARLNVPYADLEVNYYTRDLT